MIDYVIIDTNIIRADFNFSSYRYANFIEYLHRTGIVLIIPDIVILEADELYNKELNEKIRSLQNIVRQIARLTDQNLDDIAANICNDRIDYEHCIQDKFRYGFQKIFYKEEWIHEVVLRSIKRRKPCSNKGEEFRDCILWLTILDFVETHKYSNVCFVSENVKDFGAGKNELHGDLVKELATKQLKLMYYSSLIDFLEIHASQTSWLTRTWLINSLNWSRLEDEIITAVRTINCSYFFELFNRTSLDGRNILYYEVVEITISKDEIEYQLLSSSEEYNKINIGFKGEAAIRYYLEDNSFEVIRTAFYTETLINCEDKKIISYSGEYFEETSALIFPVTY